MTTTVSLAKKGSIVSTEHVNSLVKNYKLERWLDNSQKIGKPDALSTWYGLDELQEFLEKARQNQADGIKMFYGVYPSDHPNEMMAGRQTVVLVATRKSHADPRSTNKAIMVSQNGKAEILAFNLGDMCPPFCGGTPPDYDGDLSMELENIGLTLRELNGKLNIL
jgi:hypothetical protein